MSNIEEPNVLQLAASSAAMHPLQQLATNTMQKADEFIHWKQQAQKRFN
jgi:hypothetical protein